MSKRLRAVANTVNKTQLLASGRSDWWARRLVQVGFLVLFLFPLLPAIVRASHPQPAAATASWLLLWDPLLALGNLLNRNLSPLVIGAPLLLLALCLLLGRSFCGWVCPLGTIIDLVRPLYFWQRNRRHEQLDGRAQEPQQPAAVPAAHHGLGELAALDPAAWAARPPDQIQPIRHRRGFHRNGDPASLGARRADLLLSSIRRHPAA